MEDEFQMVMNEQNIPEQWIYYSIEELTPKNKQNTIVDGPFGSNLKTIHYRKSGIPIITSGFVTDGKFCAKEYLYVDKEKFKKEKRSAVQGGDIVMAKIGERCGASAILPEEHQKGILSGNALKITIDEKRFSKELIAQILWSRHISGALEILRTTGAQPAISMSNLKKYKIPLPPTKAEQRAIATVLNEADNLITALEKLIAKKRAIKQGAMQELLKPKEGWVEKSFLEISDLIHGHQFLTSDFIESDDGIKVVKIGNVQEGEFDINGCDCIGKNRLNVFKQYLLKEGDILMSLTGNIGRVVIVPRLSEPLLQNYRVGKFIPKGVDNSFLAYCLASPNTTKQLITNSNKTSQANFGKQDFEKIRVFIPMVIEKQKKIAQILSDMDNEIAELEKKLAKYKLIKQGMMQVLLTGKIRLV